MLAGMIESRSLAFALTVAGGVALVVIFAVAMLIQPVPQGYLEYKCGFGSAGAGRAARSVYDLDRAGMVKTATFYVAIVAFAFGCTSGMMVISQVSAIMQESFALTATQAAFYVSIMSFMSMSGRFLWGIVTDHFDKYITLCIICGLPVIASDFPLWRELTGKSCALFVDPQKVEEIAGAMTFLLENPDRAKAMGEAGRKLALKKYCWQSEEKRLLTLYRKLLEGEKA